MPKNLTGLSRGPAAMVAKYQSEYKELHDVFSSWETCVHKGNAHRTRQLYAERILTVKEGPRPPGAVVRHLCRNDSTSEFPCCNPNHLTWGTPKENAADGIDAGNRNFLREDHPVNTKVTCPVCGKMGSGMIMQRWHFDRCRHRLNPL